MAETVLAVGASSWAVSLGYFAILLVGFVLRILS